MDRYTALRVFRCVSELGSFAQAGRTLQLSPAAVSKNISELEAHVGARLIQRTTRRMALTEAGDIYLVHVKRALDAMEDADQALGPVRSQPRGTLRVSAPLTVTMTWLSTTIPRFLSRYPEITLDLDLDDRRVDLIREGYDLAISGRDQLENSSLIARQLTIMEHVVCASPTYLAEHGVPARPTDLMTHKCVRFSLSGHADTWEFRKNGVVEQIKVRSRYSVSSSLAVRDALLSGLGLSLIPLPYVREHISEGRLKAVMRDWVAPTTTLYAVYPSRHHLAPKVRVFVDFVREQFGEHRAA